MIIRFLLLYLVVAFTWLTGSESAYSKEYYSEPVKDSLLIELKEVFSEVSRHNQEEANALIDSFKNIWMSDGFNQKQREIISNTFESFESMRMRPWPDKGLYIKVLIGVVNTLNSQENFMVLHESFQDMLNIRRRSRFLSFLEKSNDFFKDNVIFESNTVTWKFTNKDYYFTFDSVLTVNFDVKGDLICYSQNDSMRIKQTTGRLLFFENKWKGDKGSYSWERVELDPDSIYSDFNNYNIDLARARFQIDSVRFFNYNFFDTPLEGKLEERIITGMKPENARYPRFTSYKAIHEINDLYTGIDYIGGFTMAGQRILGTSADEQSAVVNIYRNDSLFVTARAEVFNIRHERIISERAAVSVYLAGDSIYHPGLNMRYNNSRREFSLKRDERGTSRAPFNNSYHELDMYCEALYWNIDEPKIELQMVRGIGDKGKAVFESSDFFSYLRYRNMQGMHDINPLAQLRIFSNKIDSREFSINDYAGHLRINRRNVKSQLIELSYFGFLSVDFDSETIILNDKLFHYLGAYAGHNDFDVIQIYSDAPVNAEVSLHNLDLNIFGVEVIPLSDTKNVNIHPYGQTITMQKNRDIYFHGRIESGLFDFYGEEFFFDYDDFKINLLNTDSMSFSVRSHEPDHRGEYSYVRVRTVLEGINGELLVDHPNNKSGELPYERYPIFNSDSKSYVYYDEDFIHNGSYTQEDVYFKVTPFTIDSLDHATTENIAFDGVFISTGIFPDFHDYLTVQPDYSLGFNTYTPEEGYPAYDGKATYKGPIDMSYEGLEANGQLKYLNATMEAKHMLMFPDSAMGDLSIFNIESQSEPVEYPSVKAFDVDMMYFPWEDDLTIEHTDKPIDIYDGLAKMKGSLRITPEGVDGYGELDLFGGEMLSENFTLNYSELEATNTTLEYLMPGKEKRNIKLHDYETYIDVKNKKGNFTASEDTSFVDLPLNQYTNSMDKIEWDYELKQFVMHNQKGRNKFDLHNLTKDELIDIDFTGYEFVSYHRDQDSLKFYVDKAVFDQQTNKIDAYGVNVIKVADAAIFPNEQEVTILPEAEIKQLYNAEIVADTNTRYHQMHNANVKIASRHFYDGNAYYDYFYGADKPHELFFENISVNDQGQTYGLSRAYKQNEFFVSTMFPFKGDINLEAPEQHFYYKGAAKMLVKDCGLLDPNWFRFEARLATDSVMIPVSDNLQDANYNDLKTSVMLAGDSLHIYPAMFSGQNDHRDQKIITANGYLTYDRGISQYVLTTKEKHLDNNLPDNLIRINPETCQLRGEGDVTFHSDDMGQVSIQSYGNVIYDLKKNSLELDIVMALDFHFVDDCLDIVKDTIKAREELPKVNVNRQKYTKAVYNMIGIEEGSLFLTEVGLGSSLRRIPSGLENTYLFSDIRLHWNQRAGSFISKGPIGLGNINTTIFNQYVSGFFEYRKHRAGDIFVLYFEPVANLGRRPGNLWFFYMFSDGDMGTVSSVSDYNDIIRNIRPRRRRLEVERGEESYTFSLTSGHRPLDFFDNMMRVIGD